MAKNKPKVVWKGPAKLKPLLVPIENLDTDPDNENVHPEEQITRLTLLLQQFGQREVLNVYPSPEGRFVIKAGEGRLRAAQVLGWTHLACIDFEGTPEEAAALRISMNQSSKLSYMDELKVAATIREIREGLGGMDQTAAMTAYSTEEMDDILTKLEQASISAEDASEDLGEATPSGEAPSGADMGPGSKPVVSYQLVFDDEDQQKKWYEFVRQLKDQYPKVDTIAGRLMQFIRDEALGIAGKQEIVLGPHGREAYTLGFQQAAEFAYFLDFIRKLKASYGGGGVESDGARLVQFAQAATGGNDGDQEADKE